jgi:hypothetical protein
MEQHDESQSLQGNRPDSVGLLSDKNDALFMLLALGHPPF